MEEGARYLAIWSICKITHTENIHTNVGCINNNNKILGCVSSERYCIVFKCDADTMVCRVDLNSFSTALPTATHCALF